MQSAIRGLVWEIWARNRTLAWVAIGLTGLEYVLSAAWPDTVSNYSPHQSGDLGFLVRLMNMNLAAVTILLVIVICSYSEINPQTDVSGFPRRLFVLPISTFLLIAVPMLMAIAMVEFTYILWARFLLQPEERTIDVGLLLATYIVLHQTALWTLHRLRSLRLLVLGFIGITFIISPIFRFVGLSNASFNSILAVLAVSGFLTSWVYIHRQRSSGGSNREWIRSGIERLSDRLYRRDKVFASMKSAQFWYEWRRSGSVFPAITASLLVAVIAPLSWYLRDNAIDSIRVLTAAVVMPLVLALPLGKAFSKPDYWSKDLAVPGFVAVRPIASVDLVAIKMKVAAASAVLSWLLVLVFVASYLAFWASHETLAMFQSLPLPIHAYSIGFSILAMMLLTWRFLVGGFWLGLSGSRRAFALSTIPYVVVPLFVLPAILIATITNSSFVIWTRTHATLLQNALVLAAAIAVLLKLALATVSWRTQPVTFRRPYLTAWFVGTIVVVTFSIMLSNALEAFVRLDGYRLHSFLILIALLAVPLVRLGAAPAALERNRHRS